MTSCLVTRDSWQFLFLSLRHHWVPLWPLCPLSLDTFHESECASVQERKRGASLTKQLRRNSSSRSEDGGQRRLPSAVARRNPKGTCFLGHVAAMHRQESDDLGEWRETTCVAMGLQIFSTRALAGRQEEEKGWLVQAWPALKTSSSLHAKLHLQEARKPEGHFLLCHLPDRRHFLSTTMLKHTFVGCWGSGKARGIKSK